MAHQSECVNRLSIRTIEVRSVSCLPQPNPASADVWLLVLPFDHRIEDIDLHGRWSASLRRFAQELNPRSVLTILTSPQDAAEIWLRVSDILQFQLMVEVKLRAPIDCSPYQLPRHHAALLVLSRYRGSLRHTKTRIAYTYCPACDRTTKDYGGKKHTYHEYGTLISDIWRDIDYSPGEEPSAVVDRLADLFGLEPHRELVVAIVVPSRSESVRLMEGNDQPVDSPETRKPVPLGLINGDAIQELQRLPTDSVDFCFADPPYNLAKRYDSWSDALEVREYLAWCDRWLDELARILRPGRTCAVLNIPILAFRHFQHMRLTLNFQSWIAWEGLSLPVRMIMPAHYAIVCFSKGSPRPLPGLAQCRRSPVESEALTAMREGYCLREWCVKARRLQGPDCQPITDLWWDIHRLKHNSRRVDHPCQLPPALMRRLIATFTYEGEVVLDPFNGAGTTTLCAETLGRRYIGIELSRKYHSLAESRHKLLKAGGNPFGKASGVPAVKNSRVRRVGGLKYAVPKKKLQLEVKRVAKLIGRLPSRGDLEKYSCYPIRYYEEYFINWGEVCAAARTTGMSERRMDKASVNIDQPTLFDDFKGGSST